jgi:hypothetical protein
MAHRLDARLRRLEARLPAPSRADHYASVRVIIPEVFGRDGEPIALGEVSHQTLDFLIWAMDNDLLSTTTREGVDVNVFRDPVEGPRQFVRACLACWDATRQEFRWYEPRGLDRSVWR